MDSPNAHLPKPLYLLYFLTGATLACVAIGIRIMERGGGPGDLPQDFVAAGYASIIGLVAGSIAYFLTKSQGVRDKIVYGLWIFLRYFLALVFLGYGFIKIVGLQFINSLIMLDTRIVDLSRNNMSVAWFFFGHSNSYEMFLGWGETVAALLLLSRRTATLGAFILMTIVVNVVTLNYLFDVTVKLNSTCYLLMTVWVLLYSYQRLLNFFILDKSSEAPVYPKFSFSNRNNLAIRALNVIIIISMIGYEAWEMFYRVPEKYGRWKTSALRGVWKVHEVDTHLDDSLWVSELRKARFYFDDREQGYIKDNQLRVLSRFDFVENTDSIRISQMAYDSTYDFNGTFKRTKNTLQLVGDWAGVPTRIVMHELVEYKPNERMALEGEFPLSSTELSRFVGNYKMSIGSPVSLVVRDNKLFRVNNTSNDMEMVYLGDNRFVYKERPSYWQFYFSDTGEMTDITYSNYGSDYRVWRLPD